MTSHCSSMPTLTRTGNKAAPTITGTPPMPCGLLAIARPAVQAGLICRPDLANVHRAGLGIRQLLGPLRGPGPLVAPALARLPLEPKPVGLYTSDLARWQPPAPVNNLGPRQRLRPWTSGGLAPCGQSYPGPHPLTLDKASESRKRLVVISHSLVPSFEAALSGTGEAISWLDWWPSTMSKFGESLPEDTHSNFQRLIVSGAKTLEFVASQTTTVLTNLLLLRRDALLSEVRSSVPTEELSRFRHAPVPSSSALFPPTLLDTALNKARAASNDALVHKALHPPRIPKRQPQGHNRASSSTANPVDRSGTSPLVPHRRQPARGNFSPAPASGGNAGKSHRG